MAELLNLYGKEAVAYMKFIQQNECAPAYAFLTNQLQVANGRIEAITVEMSKLSDTGLVAYDKETEQAVNDLRDMRKTLSEKQLEYDSLDAKLKSLDLAAPNSLLRQKQQELQQLRLEGKTDKHWDVVAKLREIQLLEQEQKAGTLIAGSPGGANGSDQIGMKRIDLAVSKPMLEKEIKDLTERIASATNRLYSRKDKDLIYAIKQMELDSAKKQRDEIQKAAREAQNYAEASLGYFGMREPATEKSINKNGRWLKVGVLALFFGFVGIFITAGIALVGEALDTTLKTPEDIMRVCKLPVLASLGDLRKMSAKQQADWAFRNLTLLKGKLSRDQDEALVCGIISANHGEGRSTWVNLLVNAASQRGLRVLTVDTRPGSGGGATAPHPPKEEPVPPENAHEESSAPEPGRAIKLPDHGAMPLVKDPLSSPEKVTAQFDGPSPQALVHIPLPGWVWSLERRQQWQDALDHWKQKDNLVIFVELPPACESESVLLAENLPQVIWLVGSGLADAAETAAHLETLRHAHCNVVGAVLNHAPPPFISSKIGRWLNPVTAIALMIGWLSLNTVGAESAAAQSELQSASVKPATEQNAFSGSARHQRAKWQERLTLGLGDVIDIHFYRNPELSRTNVLIGPDGRIDYLQAIGVPAAGLTVDELREKLDRELEPVYANIRTIVIPVSFSSKKYFMLGKVNSKGTFVLDRPLTLIEAVARAKGLETGLYQRTTVELADLGHSFIVRDGRKVPVNFEKLFLEGDLSQNVAIEPNDYIYFASTGAQDIYVIGEVMNPGPLGFLSSATVISAITDRGGFTDRAFKRRVLVVRGSLNEPETFVINTDSALDGHLRDFQLQPRDIVYVSRRPWVKAEELADEAAQSFIQGAVTAWAGENIGPVITGRLLPRLK
jgi:protein involved in polysaccharide export with SLBB domain